jgi:hypothetical protein
MFASAQFRRKSILFDIVIIVPLVGLIIDSVGADLSIPKFTVVAFHTGLVTTKL